MQHQKFQKKKTQPDSLYDFVEFCLCLLLFLLLCFCLRLDCCCCCSQRTLSFYCSFWLLVRSSCRCCCCCRLAEFLQQQLQQCMSNCKRELSETNRKKTMRRLFNRRKAAKTTTMTALRRVQVKWMNKINRKTKTTTTIADTQTALPVPFSAANLASFFHAKSACCENKCC